MQRPGRLGWQSRWLGKNLSEGVARESGGWLDAGLKGRDRLLAYPFSASPPGVLFSNGPGWRKLSNFALGTLTEFGLGAHRLEEAAFLANFKPPSVGLVRRGERDLVWV